MFSFRYTTPSTTPPVVQRPAEGEDLIYVTPGGPPLTRSFASFDWHKFKDDTEAHTPQTVPIHTSKTTHDASVHITGTGAGEPTHLDNDDTSHPSTILEDHTSSTSNTPKATPTRRRGYGLTREDTGSDIGDVPCSSPEESPLPTSNTPKTRLPRRSGCYGLRREATGDSDFDDDISIPYTIPEEGSLPTSDPPQTPKTARPRRRGYGLTREPTGNSDIGVSETENQNPKHETEAPKGKTLLWDSTPPSWGSSSARRKDGPQVSVLSDRV